MHRIIEPGLTEPAAPHEGAIAVNNGFSGSISSAGLSWT